MPTRHAPAAPRPRMPLCLAAVLALGACGGDGTGPGSEPPGCYALTLGEWTARHEAVDPPPSLRLTTELGADGLEQGHTLVAAGDSLRPAPYEWSWWSQGADGRLELVFTGGYVGIRMDLASEGDGWRGTAEAFTDVAPSTEAIAPARLDRTACGS